MARPRIQINMKEFEGLCNMQCTLEEIAGFFNCSVDTIENWCKREYKERFSDVYKKKSVNGKISLRRIQFRLAETNTAMAIWLGKQHLGQRDHEQDTTNQYGMLPQILDYLKEKKVEKNAE